jgi:RNA polymerase sigma-54 factor
MMRFETSQNMRLGQHMKLAPRMIQSMEILQMPLAELEERIEQELESNPTLELADGSLDAGEAAAIASETGLGEGSGTIEREEGQGTNSADFERLESFESDNPDAAENAFDGGGGSDHPSELESPQRQERDRYEDFGSQTRTGDGDRDAKMDAMAAAPARGASLHDQLRGQWSLVDIKPELRPLGELLISFVEEDGYIRTDLATIADRAPITPEGQEPPLGMPRLTRKPTVAELEHVLGAVQLLLEPAGVAARTHAECLILQLDAMEDQEDSGWPPESFTHARLLVGEHLEDLTQNRLPRVAERSGLTIDEVRETMTLLKRLSLAPARRLVDEAVRPIVPDAIVEYDEASDRYVAYLNDRAIPNVRINQQYAMMTKDKALAKNDRDFIKVNLGNAQWLLDAVGQRRHTLLRVVKVVVDAQREFFDYGPQALKPLPMTGVAEQLGIHVATVSRAVAEKYLLTPRGVVALRKFFSGGLATEGGSDMAWDAIKEALKDVIDAEDRAKPLSDEQLVAAMKDRGIEIARRTVAKYRDQLGIPTARLRRKF